MNTKIKCPYCDKEYNSYNSVSLHCRSAHKEISMEQLLTDIKYNGIRPTCKCGCGNYTNMGFKSDDRPILKIFVDFCRGHQSRVHNNWGHNPTAIAKSTKTRKKQFKNGERTTWNKGVTGDDYKKHFDKEDGSNSLMDTYKDPIRNKKISDGLSGKKQSSDHAKQNGDRMRKYWSQQVNKDRQRENRLQYFKDTGRVFTSGLETTIKELFDFNDIPYEQQFVIGGYPKYYDFKIKNRNILIEINGDFWHCNPTTKFAIPQYEFQINNVRRDKEKSDISINNGYKLLIY